MLVTCASHVKDTDPFVPRAMAIENTARETVSRTLKTAFQIYASIRIFRHGLRHQVMLL
jgi:hypothetical protein